MIGIIEFTESKLTNLDKEIGNSKINFKIASKTRLYLNRKENGRDFKKL
jgi:hypothetical protein